MSSKTEMTLQFTIFNKDVLVVNNYSMLSSDNHIYTVKLIFLQYLCDFTLENCMWTCFLHC